MAGYTDKPQGQRPNCPECGDRFWSHDGHCLSAKCKPLELFEYMSKLGKKKGKK